MITVIIMTILDELRAKAHNTLYVNPNPDKNDAYLTEADIDLLIRAVEQFGAARPFQYGYVEEDRWVAFDEDIIALVNAHAFDKR